MYRPSADGCQPNFSTPARILLPSPAPPKKSFAEAAHRSRGALAGHPDAMVLFRVPRRLPGAGLENALQHIDRAHQGESDDICLQTGGDERDGRAHKDQTFPEIEIPQPVPDACKGKRGDAYRSRAHDKDDFPVARADHQQAGVVTEDIGDEKTREGQLDRHEPGGVGFGPGDTRRGIGGQGHRGRQVREDAEVHDEQMGREHGHAKALDGGGRNGGEHDIFRRGGQPHAQNDGRAHGEHQGQGEAPGRKRKNGVCQLESHAGERHHADDKARAGAGG